MLLSTITQLLIIFTLNAVSTSLGTLKAIFLSKQIIKPVYVTTFIDAVIFAYGFKLLAGSSGLLYVLVFALGRIAGVFIGNAIENKVAIGLVEITANKHPQEGKALADELRAQGYSVTTMMGYGVEGKSRLVLTITIPRRDLPEVKELLTTNGNVNMSIKDVSSVAGKVGRVSVSSTRPVF